MTLLETVWNLEGTEGEVIHATATALEDGALKLTGNFKGFEAEVAAQAKGRASNVKIQICRGFRTVEVEATANLKDIRTAQRSTYGWQGGHGVALTVTAHCSTCERRVTVKYSETVEGLEVFHEGERNGYHVAEPITVPTVTRNR